MPFTPGLALRVPFNLTTLTNRYGGRGAARVFIFNESGPYSLILGGKKPAAKDFKRWVTSVVLPAIRKDGASHGLCHKVRCDTSVAHSGAPSVEQL